jgi:hypothetical protein
MSDTPGPTPSLFGTPREWAKDLTTATVVGAFLGVIGPFGSFYGGGLEIRVVYWIANLWIGFIVISLSVRLSLRAASRFDLPVPFVLAIGVAIGCLPLGLVIGLFSAAFWPGNHGRLSSFYVWYGQTLVISEPFSFAFYFVREREWKAAVAKPSAPASPAVETLVEQRGADFLNRLPPRLGRDLLCLQMEDHYVRAHTATTSDLILIPLKDAIAELGDTPGMQVHRSWWVARSAVAEPVANGRNLSLRLINGLEVPVSRASVAKLKLAGWLDGKMTPGESES